MSDELAAETIDTDNSNDIAEENTEPSENNLDDNSDNGGQEPVKSNEAENNDGAKDKSKFSTLEEAVKSYSELEKKLGQQSNELGELRKQAEEAKQLKEQLEGLQLQEAQNNGYNSVQEYQYSKEIAKNTANEFAKYINEVEYPSEVLKMLNEYCKNPSKELLDSIESEFSVEAIKKVAAANAVFQGQLEAQLKQAHENQTIASVREYLNTNVKKYADEFKNKAFTDFFGEALCALGCNLDADRFVKLAKDYAQSVVKSYGIKQGIERDNVNETDEIEGLSANGSNTEFSSSGKSLLNMSASELDKRLTELI